MDKFTLCKIQRVIDSGGLDEFVKEKGLKLDFSASKCDCGELFKCVKDSGFSRSGVCWSCSDRQCKRRFSINLGSWFENTNHPEDVVLKLTYCWVKKFPNVNAAEECGVSEKNIVDWYNFCREVCIQILDENEEVHGKIGGEGAVVKLDESKFGKRFQHKGRIVDGVWVLGGMERDDKKRR